MGHDVPTILRRGLSDVAAGHEWAVAPCCRRFNQRRPQAPAADWARAPSTRETPPRPSRSFRRRSAVALRLPLADVGAKQIFNWHM